MLDLTNADLSGVDLCGADLTQANIGEANLSGAKLVGANLYNANLGSANLTRAILVDVYTYWTNFRQADLGEAWLDGAVLNAAILDRADFSGAQCGVTIFADCDLSRVRRLDTVRHAAYSTIGVDTLVRTLQGAGRRFTPSQLAFFRGAWVPEAVLDYLPSLLESHPIQFFSCFITYGARDETFADRLYRDLTTRGVRCWKYDVDALVGRGVWANIDRAIVLHDKDIVVCSQSGLQRPGVLREIERALQREDELIRQRAASPEVEIDTDVLVPVRLDDYVLTGWEHPRKADVVAKHIGDFRGWDKDEKNYQRGMQQLLRALDPRSKLGLSAGPGPRRPV